jgi:copper transport protein
VLAVAAVLVQTSPGTTAEANTPAGEEVLPGQPRVYTVRTDKITVQADVDPGEQGNNTLHVYAFTPDGLPQSVEEWTINVSLPGRGLEKIEAQELKITPNHAAAEVQIPVAGDWRFSFTARISDIDEITVSQSIPIR